MFRRYFYIVYLTEEINHEKGFGFTIEGIFVLLLKPGNFLNFYKLFLLYAK